MACKGSGVRIPVPPLVGLNPIGWTALMRVQSDFRWTGCLRYGVHFRMSTIGSRFEEHEPWTTSMAIAQFVHAQRPKGATPSCKGSRLLQSGDGMLSAECTPRNGGAHGVGNYRTLGRDVTEMLPCNGDLQKVHNVAAS